MRFNEHYLEEEIKIPDTVRVFNSGKIKNFDERLILKDYQQLDKSKPKPIGLWYGFGTSWIDWTASEMPEWSGGDNYEVLNIEHLKILLISDSEELLKFTKEYGDRSVDPIITIGINWKKVAEKYDGIEINPYIRSMRMNNRTEWYYPWDVASGCVWKAKDIKLRKIEDEEYK